MGAMKEIQDLNRHGVHRNVTHYIPETPAEWEEHRLRYGRRLAKVVCLDCGAEYAEGGLSDTHPYPTTCAP